MAEQPALFEPFVPHFKNLSVLVPYPHTLVKEVRKHSGM